MDRNGIPRKKRNADAPSHAAAPSWHRTPLMPMRGLQHNHARPANFPAPPQLIPRGAEKTLNSTYV